MSERLLPVWPFYLLAGLVALPGLGLLMSHYQADVAAESTLTRFSGTVDEVTLVNDFLGTSIGFLERFDSAYFQLEGQPEMFVIPSVVPAGRGLVERSGFEVEIWVDQRVHDPDQPLMVYKLVQHLPADAAVEPTRVSYDQMAAELAAYHRHYERLGAILVVVGAAFFVIGKLADIWNRHKDELTS